MRCLLYTSWSRNEQLLKLAEFARQTPHPLLLLGDLNLTPWSPYFERLLAGSGLRDSRDGRGLFPTWPVGWPPLWIPVSYTHLDVYKRQALAGAVLAGGYLILNQPTEPSVTLAPPVAEKTPAGDPATQRRTEADQLLLSLIHI